jgi:predicted lipoprotein with Yx(FWY)xxD motif
MRSSAKSLVPTLVLTLLLALAASLTLAACGSSSSNSGSSSQASSVPAGTSSSSGGEGVVVVKSASNATLGTTVLVDAQGMTLYRLSAEQNGKLICTSSACLQVWHPLSASAGTPSGSVGSLGTVRRPDGSEQVTYRGMPLYTFAQDRKPGEARGQGIKDVGTWTTVTVGSGGSNSAPAPAAASTTTTSAESAAPASSGGSRYGY